ncbi:MAG TPA: hypothetical protein VN783_16235 [Thermoanaerobaculia bacterium]|nr:hypothetical protein [Thermoanaerobaculia bacterium]
MGRAKKDRVAADSGSSGEESGAPDTPEAEARRAQSAGRTEEARDLLDRLIRARRISYLEMDRRLGYGRGRTRLMAQGQLDLKYQPLIEILEELGVDPGAYFQALFPSGERSLAEPLEKIFGDKMTRAGIPLARAEEAGGRKPAEGGFDLESSIDRIIEDRLQASIAKIFRDLAEKTSGGPREDPK